MSFETLLPLIGAIFVLCFGLYVALQQPKAKLNLLFLAFCAAITYWLFGTFEMYLFRDVEAQAIFWDRFVYIGVVFVPTLMHQFSLEITGHKGQRKLLFAGYVYAFAFLILSRTDWFVTGLNVFPRVIHTRAVWGHHVFLVLFMGYASVMFVNLWRYWKSTRDARRRTVTLLTAAAFLNVIVIGGTAYLPAYGFDIGYPFSYFSGIFFVILLAIAVAQYQFASAKVLIAEMFTFLVSLIFLADIMLSRGVGELIFRTVMLGVFIYFGAQMIRTVRLEIHRREEIQKLATELEKSNVTLRALEELESTMIGIATHQIRGPLGGIRGYLTMFKEGDLGPVTGKQKDILSLNLNVLSRLLNAVETFLDITKLQSGKILLQPDVVDLDELVLGITREFEVPMQQRSLSFTYTCAAPKPVMVKVDPEKLKHVIFNLIDNAHKYTEKGGVKVSLRIEDQEAIVSVTDTGMGIAPEDVPRLFGKFERGSLVVDRGGSGLGLFVVKMLTEMQGGRVWVCSPGTKRGTTFSVAFPLAARP